MNRPSLNVLPLFVGCVLVLSCSAHTADDTAEQGETDADDTDALADALNDTATDTATDPPPQGDIDASSDVTTDGAPLDADATIDAADAEGRASALQRRLCQPIEIAGQELVLGISLGYALGPRDASSAAPARSSCAS